MERYFVVEATPRPARCLFQGRSISACLDWIGDRWRGLASRPAVWVDLAPTEGDPDAFVCLPVWFLDAWREHAEEVVDGWEARWLLLESAPRGHRAEARADLIESVAKALTMASQSTLPDDETDVGF